MAAEIRNILVLCTGNSARSILAEAILNREGEGRLRAWSAGSQPKGVPNPVGIKLLADLGYDVSALRSKSWSEFAGAGAPKMHLIITVCDSAAGESCPLWPGQPLVAHWGIPDPAGVGETPVEQRAAFQLTYQQLMQRVTALLAPEFETLPPGEFKALLAKIGAMDGATEQACKHTSV
jgi:protein-tyrosine-phosphatase